MSLLLDWKYKSNCQSPGKVFRVEELLSSGNSRGMKLMTTRDRWRWRWRWRYRSRCRWRRRMAGQVSVWKFPPNCIYCWLQLKGFLLPWLQCNYDKLGNSFQEIHHRSSFLVDFLIFSPAEQKTRSMCWPSFLINKTKTQKREGKRPRTYPKK